MGWKALDLCGWKLSWLSHDMKGGSCDGDVALSDLYTQIVIVVMVVAQSAVAIGGFVMACW